ncbi:MAG: aspartate aminotransferase family protein [Clostridiaceae bacterium]|jgi:acetylornithine/N-succinyldiaminopimelate aminotransferase|nr:aspartate aminotransferase family protein [Bacillota bacterium]NLN51304.1 aspartate aminotransferase family protein [Clostridiaceae bacterium]
MIIKQLDDQYIANTYNRFPVTITKGKGSIVWDEQGKEYIDLSGGIAVNTFGFADQDWLEAINNQLNQVQHTSNLYYTEPATKLAELLCQRTGLKKVFFSNSGGEANECAIKVARKYAADKKGSDYFTIITLVNSFHGRTITTLAATGQASFHQDFTPLTEGFVYAKANDFSEIEKLASQHKCAAIMLEVVQGEGGVNVLEQGYLKQVAEFCQKHDLLLIIDEVQTGNGRTGELFGYMNFDLKPDIVSTAKGLGGGLPIGATLLGEKVKSTLTPGTHGSTFGGNPVCCAGALSVIQRIDAELLTEVKQKSELIRSSLIGSSGIKDVSGLGLMLGIETERKNLEVIEECIEQGVLVISAKDKVRLLPALNISQATLIKAINVIKEICAV